MAPPFAPAIRVRPIRPDDPDQGGRYVLYWMTAYRRTTWNFALQHAAAWASQLHKPLLVLEALRCDYPWASDRLHRFVVQGLADNAAALSTRPVTYYPYVEAEPSAGRGLLAALARHAAVVVTDDFPCFFHPALIRAARRQIPTRFEAVDSNGMYPMHAADRVFSRAVDFRRFLQNQLPNHWRQLPLADPLDGVSLPEIATVPATTTRRWPLADLDNMTNDWRWLTRMPIDHGVAPAAAVGGSRAASETLREFIANKLSRYADERNQPEQDVASGLSPYLHFGQIAVQQVFQETMRRDGWTPPARPPRATASNTGWWGTSREVESFLDELITWRELGFNFCSKRRDYDQYESLPEWAQATLARHARDARPYAYELAEFEHAATHDPLWNAAQRQLVREGRIHNYLRMLWGKKILEWSTSPRVALDIMIQLNNKYALDGRDPNSYSGIFWVLGRYDRPWAPERPIFGQIRYMSSDNTARKLRVKGYLRQFGA